MSRKRNTVLILNALGRTWAFVVSGPGVISLLIISSILGFVAHEQNWLNLAKTGISSDALLGVYIVLLSLFLVLFVFFVNFVIVTGNRAEQDALLELANLRVVGVNLRNEGARIDDILFAKRWMENYDLWDEQATEAISRLISATEGAKFKVVNRFPLTGGNLPTLISTHNRKFNVLEEKLARLEKLLE